MPGGAVFYAVLRAPQVIPDLKGIVLLHTASIGQIGCTAYRANMDMSLNTALSGEVTPQCTCDCRPLRMSPQGSSAFPSPQVWQSPSPALGMTTSATSRFRPAESPTSLSPGLSLCKVQSCARWTCEIRNRQAQIISEITNVQQTLMMR